MITYYDIANSKIRTKFCEKEKTYRRVSHINKATHFNFSQRGDAEEGCKKIFMYSILCLTFPKEREREREAISTRVCSSRIHYIIK